MGIRMKICHLAAFVLMGWYLMVPPPLPHSRDRIVPLSQWTRAHVFQSEESCEMKGTALSKLDAALGPYRGFLPEQFYDAQCVAADDPRLKP